MSVNVKLNEFQKVIDSLNNKMKYPGNTTYISDCSGNAIDRINACISKFDLLGKSVDCLFSNTSNYLSNVYNNYVQNEDKLSVGISRDNKE